MAAFFSAFSILSAAAFSIFSTFSCLRCSASIRRSALEIGRAAGFGFSASAAAASAAASSTFLAFDAASLAFRFSSASAMRAHLLSGAVVAGVCARFFPAPPLAIASSDGGLRNPAHAPASIFVSGLGANEF